MSFGFSWDIEFEDNIDKSGEKFLEALPSMNHQFLQEFHLKGDGKASFTNAAKFLDPVNENILKYLEKCPELKILKFEFKPEVNQELKIDYPFLSNMEESIISFKLKNLQEFHLIGVDLRFSNFDGNFLETIAENLPKLKRLCLICQDHKHVNRWKERFEAFASGKNIKLEISSVIRYVGACTCAQSWKHPIEEMEIFGPI